MKKTYESPKFGFQEMKLFERVADVCWGTAQIWLDTNNDGKTDKEDIQIVTGGGCQGSWSADALTTEISAFNTMVSSYNSSHEVSIVTEYNAELGSWLQNKIKDTGKEIDLVAISASPSSNWANTKQNSGGGIIIKKSY